MKLAIYVILLMSVVFSNFAFGNYVYLTTPSGVTRLDLINGDTEKITDYSGLTGSTPRGIAVGNDGYVYVGTTASGSLSNRVLQINPSNGAISQYTSPVSTRYGLGQIGFNNSGELFVAGDTDRCVYKYAQDGTLLETIVWVQRNNVGLCVDGDMVYSIGYFPPPSMLQYNSTNSVRNVYNVYLPDSFHTASITKGHNGNFVLGQGRAGSQIWEYSHETNELNMLFDLSPLNLITTFFAYNPFDNTYLIPSNNQVTVLDINGSVLRTFSSPDLVGCYAITEVIPEPATLCLLTTGILLLRRK